MVECLPSVQKVPGSVLHQVYFLFVYTKCCNCSIYYLLHIQHLLAVVNPALLITFFSYGQSTFLQCYSVALPKRLISCSVHAGSTSHANLRHRSTFGTHHRRCVPLQCVAWAYGKRHTYQRWEAPWRPGDQYGIVPILIVWTATLRAALRKKNVFQQTLYWKT